MQGTRYESLQPISRTQSEKGRKPRKKQGSLLVWTLSLTLWGVLLAGAYLLADHYIGGIYSQLEQIEETNARHVDALSAKLAELEEQMAAHQEQAQQLSEQFAAVLSDLEAVKEEMSLAGDTLHSSTETKQALNERINVLSRELEELRKLIRRLEEAARVY